MASQHLIGLISDTHGLLRPDVHDALAGVELILHAGDVGGEEILLPVDSDGLLDLEALGAALARKPAVVSVMWVNNETGVVQPIGPISVLVGPTRHTLVIDAVQALGKLEQPRVPPRRFRVVGFADDILLDLDELVDAQEAADVLARASRLAPEARGIARIEDRELRLLEDLARME